MKFLLIPFPSPELNPYFQFCVFPTGTLSLFFVLMIFTHTHTHIHTCVATGESTVLFMCLYFNTNEFLLQVTIQQPCFSNPMLSWRYFHLDSNRSTHC